MQRTYLMTAAIVAASCLLQGLGAQTPPPERPAVERPAYYRLDFSVKEVEGGKTINTRSYSMSLASLTRTSMRIGNKVPYQVGSNSTNYVDIGVNIDCAEPKQDGKDLMLIVDADVSSIASTESTSNLLPLIRQNKWRANVIVPIGKPTVIFSSDDVGTRRQMQLELTATPIK